MSGFFEDLVARSFAPAVALRPRLQSLYEPPVRDDGPRIDGPTTLSTRRRQEQVLEEAGEDAQSDTPRRTTHEGDRDVADGTQRMRPLHTQTGEAWHPLSTTKPATPRMAHAEKNDAPLVSLVSHEVQTPSPKPVLQPSPVHTIQPVSSPAATNAVRGVESRAQDSPSPRRMPERPAPLKPSPAPLTQPVPPQVIQAVAPRREPRESSELRPPILPPALLMPTVNNLRPLAVERSLRHSEAPRPAMRASSEPTVHVTIGRIEIRAEVQEPPARPAARPRPPAGPNLDDYLRQHAQKGRS